MLSYVNKNNFNYFQAALYSHIYPRHMEDDTKVDIEGCKDIARQLIEDKVGKNINVIFGGGMDRFVPEDDENDEDGGKRKDGRNLTSEWIDLHPKGEFIRSRDEMMNISDDTEHVLGIFAKSHMSFNVDRDPEIEPSLSEMTLKAIEILNRNNSRGFLLIVEAAKIDLAHHYNNAYRALDDTLALDEAVKIAVENIGKGKHQILITE